MAISILNLPIDIPWKQLAISRDMYATNIGNPLPLKWRSSLAVFFYEPIPDPTEPSNPDERTTFLKIVATVTGFQPDGTEIDAGALMGGRFSSTVIENFDQLASSYYGALSALLQVAVYPAGGSFPIEKFPYLTDFEPKKREVVELVSETGEALTQSSTNLNVRKGTTSTNSTENVDIDRGGSFGLSVKTPIGGIGLESSQQQEVGTRSSVGSGTDHIVTTDSSREKRESFSHTTNLSQLYHALDSYHAGTNRALFFLNARPHIVDSPYTFVKGPRQLEGIQEFFLVVRRPKEMTDFCVKAELETAHLHETDETVTTGQTVFDQNQISQTFTLHADGGHFSADDRAGNWSVNIPGGYHLDRSRGGGTYDINGHHPVVPAGVDYSISYTTDSDHTDEAIPTITTWDDHVDFSAHIYGVANLTDPVDGNLTLTVTVYYISDQPSQTPTTTTVRHLDLFLTARSVQNCTGAHPVIDNQIPVWVSYEHELPAAALQQLVVAKGAGREAAIAANMLARYLRQQVISSFRSSKRYEPRTVDFFHTRFAIRDLSRGAQDANPRWLNQLVTSLSTVPDAIRKYVKKTAPNLTVSDVVRTDPDLLARGLGVPKNTARALYTSILGVAAAREQQAVSQEPAPGGKAATIRDRGRRKNGPSRGQ